MEASPLRRSVQFDEAGDTSDEEPALSSAAQDALKVLSFQEAERENGGSDNLFQEIWGLSQVRFGIPTDANTDRMPPAVQVWQASGQRKQRVIDEWQADYCMTL